MSKIYSALSANEAERFIGLVGYFGDDLTQITNREFRSILQCVNESNCKQKFKSSDGQIFWALFQPIENSNGEDTKTENLLEAQLDKLDRITNLLDAIFGELSSIERSLRRALAYL